MSFIARQPNGLLCRHSGVIDCVTDYNMTDENYVSLCMEKAKAEAYKVIEHGIMPFSEVRECFLDNNMSRKKFEEILEEMQRPKEECHWQVI